MKDSSIWGQRVQSIGGIIQVTDLNDHGIDQIGDVGAGVDRHK